MKDLIKQLSNGHFIGSEQNLVDTVTKMLGEYADEVKTDLTGGIYAFFKGETDKTVMLEAHIDEIGFTVTNVLENGFLRLSAVGGVDIRTLPATTVVVHGKRDIKGVFTSTPPHLAKDKQKEFSPLDEIFVDTGLEDANDVISVGDFATFNTKAVDLQNDFISGKSLDNRTGCAVMLDIAKRIKQSGKNPPCNIIILLASGEELGNRGAKIGGFRTDFGVEADEAIVVDVSFGLSNGCPSDKCGECKKGAMLGISPILDKGMVQTLKGVAESEKIPYQLEVMNGLTSTDADALTVTKSGIKCALISIPLKYMHTPVETVYVPDVKAVSDLIFGFITQEGK